MATDNRKIQIETEVVANTDGLDKIEKGFVDLGTAATRETSKAAAAFKKIGDEANAAGVKLDRSTKSIISYIQRETLALEAGGKATLNYALAQAELKGVDPRQLESSLAVLSKVTAETQRGTTALQQSGKQLNEFGQTAKQASAALRQVPAQFTDIVVSLQGGQAPLTVLLQQGGQLKDVFGGIAPAVQALGGYIKGLINPLTLAAAAAGALAIGFFKGSAEAEAFQKTLILTGNSAGTTAGQLSTLAAKIDQTVGTQAKAAEVLNQLAAAGNIAVGSFEKLTVAAIAFERAGGGAAESVVKQFAELGKDPLTASIKLNEATNFLTRSTYEQIRALTEQGRVTEAATVAQEAYANSLNTATPQLLQNLGYIERAWINVKDIVKEAGDSILSLGRSATPESTLEDLRKQLTQAQTGLYSRGQIPELERQIALLEKATAATKEKATAERESGLALKQVIEFDKEGLKYRSEAQKFAAAAIEQAGKYNLALQKGGIEALAYQQLIAAKRKEIFKETETAGDSQLAQLRARRTELEQYLVALRTEGSEAKKITEDEKTRNQIQEKLKGSLTETARVQLVLALQVAEQNTALAQTVRLEEARTEAVKKAQKEYEKLVEKIRGEATSILAQATAQEAANSALGKSRTAIAEATLLTYQEELKITKAAPEYVAALKDKTDAQQRYVTALKAGDYAAVNERSLELLRNATELEKVYEDEFKLSQLTALERQKITAQRQIDLKYAKELADLEKKGLTAEQLVTQREILNEAKFREISAAVNKVLLDDFTKTADQINQSLTDALLRGFESGKSFASNMRDTIVNMFKTMVLRPVIQAIVNPMAMTLTSALGLGGGGAQAGGAGGITGMASSFSSAFNAINNGVSSAITNGFRDFAGSSFGQKLGLSTEIAGPPTAAGQAATKLSEAGQSISKALGMAGNALAGYGLQKAISGGFETGNKGLVDAITLGGSAIFGPLFGVGAGVFNRLFGKKLTDVGIRGTFGGEEGFTGEQYQRFKGGVFSSSKTKTKPLSTEMESVLDTQFRELQAQTAVLAGTLGLGSDAIENFTKDVKISFKKLTPEQITKKLEETFAIIEEDLAKTVLGSFQFKEIEILGQRITTSIKEWIPSSFVRDGEKATEALKRLSGSLVTANAAFDLMGYKLYEISLAGANAASTLVDFFGGLEAFQTSTASYYETFYTEAERFDAATNQVAKSLTELGLAMPTTRLAYRVEVEKALAAGNEELFASLVKLAPAFANITQSVDDLAITAKQNADAAYADAKTATDAAFTAVQRAVKAASDKAEKTLTDTYNALTKTLTAQKEAAVAAQDVAQTNLATVKGLFDLLKNEIASLVDAAGAGMTAAQGRSFIQQAIATARTTGYLPEQDALAGAISAVSSSIQQSTYTTAFEQKRDRLVLAGQLGELQGLTEDQMTIAEQQLEATKNQLDVLEEQLVSAKDNYDKSLAANEAYYTKQLEAAEKQYNALREIDTSVLSVEDALKELASAIKAEAIAAINPVPPPAGSGGGRSSIIDNARAYGEANGPNAYYFVPGVNDTRAKLESATLIGQRLGWTPQEAILKITGKTEAEWRAIENDFYAGLAPKAYANGGYYPGGMALVGEQGPELINFQNPGQVYNASQTSTMLGGNVMLVEEIRALRDDNQTQARAMVQIQARLTKLMERWDSNGLPETRAVV